MSSHVKAFQLKKILVLIFSTGIEVGHQFFSLAEMLAVGFSGHWLGGVDHMKNTCSKSVFYLQLIIFSLSLSLS